MNIDEVVDAYLEGAPDLQILRLEGFDDCCLGIIERCGDQPILFYSADRIVIKLIDGGLEPEAAHEHFDFNIIGSYLGPGTPAFM